MLITHLHFDGNCNEAIKLYEKAFDTEAYIVERFGEDNKRIVHARMDI